VNYTDIIKYGIFPEVLRVEMEYDKENDPILYSHKWLGEPMGQAELAIIPRQSVLDAMQRNITDEGATIVGADIARMGNDRTVLWKRKGLKTLDKKVFTKLRTTEICDQLEMFVDYDKSVEIRIDDTGVGGGVTDEMMKRGYNVTAVNFGGEASDSDKYPNWISEAWFHMRDVISESQLPMDSDLIMELSTREWGQDNKGRRRVESKQDYKKRGFRSPDLADACIICYSQPYMPAILGWMRSQAANREAEN
jgi:phage terminase large subunit